MVFDHDHDRDESFFRQNPAVKQHIRKMKLSITIVNFIVNHRLYLTRGHNHADRY